MDVRIEDSWRQQLKDEFDKTYFSELVSFVRTEYQQKKVFPPAKLIFNAFDQTPFDKVKVVILGQDPYHNDGQAHGLAFSVNDETQIPPSLVNIYKEINQEFGSPIPQSGNLLRWTQQGVLLLNATLTVEAHKAGSHQGRGWEMFTDAAICKIAQNRHNIVFMLWGAYAQKKKTFINSQKHLILSSPHPSPLSAHRGFLGNNHFKLANEYLISKGKEPIKW